MLQPFENIKKREVSSELELYGRNFVIGSFNPLEGNYILMQLLTFILPFGIGDVLKTSLGVNIGNSTRLMPKEEFKQLQIDILSVVKEVMPETGHKAPVIRPDGTFGVQDMTMGLIINLLVATLAFNFKDFFGELPLTEEPMNQ